jgi:hypothetical protein
VYSRKGRTQTQTDVQVSQQEQTDTKQSEGKAMIAVYYTVMSDGTYLRSEKDLQTGHEVVEEITEDQFKSAMNEYDTDLIDWT